MLLPANTPNSVLLKQRRIPFTVVETDSLQPLGPQAIAAARRMLGKTVISISDKKVLSGKPWISRYGKPSAGGALTSLVGELFGALPPSESALAFSERRGEWRLAGYRVGAAADAGSARPLLDRMLK